MEMAAGQIDAADVASRLGEGVYVNSVWYLNYSDRPSCRITGMTRFATFWVEGGRIVAPLNVMRFDETGFRVLGENLLGLTRERDFIPSSSTYHGRSTSSIRLPGALVENFAFTL
jgi:predicted Zn-dependent protease